MDRPDRSTPTADERAISPVIGVILMVSLAVVIATMIGGFTMDMGRDLTKATPQAEFTFDYNVNANTLTITHDGGASFSEDNTESLVIRQTGSSTATTVWVDGSTGSYPVSAGDQQSTSFSLSSGDEVRVIWTAEDGGTTATISTFRVP